MQIFRCPACGASLYFHNTGCTCGQQVVFAPDAQVMLPLAEAEAEPDAPPSGGNTVGDFLPGFRETQERETPPAEEVPAPPSSPADALRQARTAMRGGEPQRCPGRRRRPRPRRRRRRRPRRRQRPCRASAG